MASPDFIRTDHTLAFFAAIGRHAANTRLMLIIVDNKALTQ
jgi:hypothetical protein